MAERQTFAFDVQAPVQGRGVGMGGVNIGQTFGGETTGGDRSGVKDANLGGVIGTFLDGLLEPYADRKAKEQFAKGVTDQMYAEAGQEIRAGKGLLTQIFGPSAYEEGAIFYEAQERVANAQNAWAAREDELKQLNSEEVSRAWADHLENTKVGDPFIDRMVEDTMLKATPQMLQSVAKARFAWQQERASAAQAKAWLAQGEAFQAQAASFAKTSDPDEQAVMGYNAATQSFLDLFQPVVGQTDEAFKKNITNVMRRMAQQGNGHALSTLLRSGALDMLDEGDKVRIEDLYTRYGKQAVAKAAADPAVMAEIDQLEFKMAYNRIGPQEALVEKRRLNERVKRATGFDVDLYDTSDQAGTIRSIWADMKAADIREEDKQFQRERQEDQQAHELELERARAMADANAAEMAWASNAPGVALASGAVKADAMKARVFKGYLDDDFAGMNRAFKDSIVSESIKGSIQNTISSSVSSGYTPEFDGLVRKFDGMVAANPALAKEYFGPAFARMRQYKKARAVGANGPTAFAQAFGDDTQYQPSGAAIAAANKDIVKFVADQQNGWIMNAITGISPLNKSGISTMANLIAREVAADKSGAGEDLSEGALMKSAMDRLVATGRFEQAGPLGWKVPEGQQPIWKSLGVPRDLAQKIIYEQVDVSLKNRGFAAGAEGDEYSINVSSRAGQPVLLVTPIDEEGSILYKSTATITVGQLRQAVINKQQRDNKAKGILSAEDQAWARIDPRRRIKGESTMDRVIRINRERALRKKAGIPEYPID